MSIPRDIELLKPWELIEDTPEVQGRGEYFSSELQREMPPKHVLFGVKARAVARRTDRDDVLFEIEFGKMPLAVVHLTWSKETDPCLPSTKLFQSWQDWVRDEMFPAHNEHEAS